MGKPLSSVGADYQEDVPYCYAVHSTSVQAVSSNCKSTKYYS